MAYDFVARKGSTARSLYFTLSSTNSLDEFSTVTGVNFYMRKAKGNENKINGVAVATFTVAANEKSIDCRYDWANEDVGEVGDFEGYAKTTNTLGQTDRFPADDKGEFIKIRFEKNFE